MWAFLITSIAHKVSADATMVTPYCLMIYKVKLTNISVYCFFDIIYIKTWPETTHQHPMHATAAQHNIILRQCYVMKLLPHEMDLIYNIWVYQ